MLLRRVANRILAIAASRTAAVQRTQFCKCRCNIHTNVTLLSQTDSTNANSAASPASSSAPANATTLPKPKPALKYSTRRILESSLWATPRPPVITNQAELDALSAKGFDGKMYDHLACFQLGQIYFDGIQPSKQPTTPATSTSTASAPITSTSSTTASPSNESSSEFVVAPDQPFSVAKNYTQSLLWFTNAAFEGHVPSKTRLGVMYLAGYGIKRSFKHAFDLFSDASAQGDRDAQAHLAGMYMQGIGVEKKDISKAIDFYSQAADRGHVRAQATLAKLLDSPEAGPHRDAQRASHWLEESARGGHTESQFLLAQRHEKSQPSKAFDWFVKAGKNGHAQSQYIVGLAYADGTLPTDIPNSSDTFLQRQIAAARWFSMSTEQGNIHAQARLGFQCFNGVGVTKDQGVGVMWMTNAAEANHVSAQLMLGSIAYDEHMAAQSQSATDKGENKKLQTAQHYFSKVLENGNKNCLTLPPGSLPLLVRLAQDASLPTHYIKLFQQRNGHPWLGDFNAFLTESIAASKAEGN